jgi:hypothetical protein
MEVPEAEALVIRSVCFGYFDVGLARGTGKEFLKVLNKFLFFPTLRGRPREGVEPVFRNFFAGLA